MMVNIYLIINIRDYFVNLSISLCRSDHVKRPMIFPIAQAQEESSSDHR
jgi:hypothetical protein